MGNGPLLSAQVLLLPNRVRLARPLGELAVEILNRIEPEGVKVISRRERLDTQEPRMLDPTREHEVTNEITLPNAHRGKRHSDLEGDARLFRKDLHVTDVLDQRHQRFE